MLVGVCRKEVARAVKSQPDRKEERYSNESAPRAIGSKFVDRANDVICYEQLPAVSKASPRAEFNPEAKLVRVPSGANL